MTLAEYLGLKSGDLRDLWDTVALATTTTDAGESSAYHPINTFLHFVAKEYFVNGGTWQIARALWDRLSDRIETSAEVTRVAQDGEGVSVIYSQGGQTHVVRAGKCVMAMPAPIALKVVDSLPGWKREALGAATYGSITSAGFLLDRPSEEFLGEGVWRVPTVRSRLVSVTNPTITFPQEVKDRTGQGLMRVYTGDVESKRLQKLSDGEALESLMEDLYGVLPDTRGHVLTGALKHWEHGGSPWLVGRLAHVPNIQAPTDNIHYAGDYTAGSGMDAAVHSASRVLTELGRGPLFPGTA
jgi:monoamine oxidase